MCQCKQLTITTLLKGGNLLVVCELVFIVYEFYLCGEILVSGPHYVHWSLSVARILHVPVCFTTSRTGELPPVRCTEKK